MLQIIQKIPSFLLVLLILPSSSAFADSNQALMELLKALQENGTIDAKTYLLVKSVAEQESASSTVAATSAASIDKKIEKVVDAKVAESNKKNNKVTINTKGKFEVASNDGDFRFRVGGRIQVDGASYAEDASRHNDGTELRRVRLFAQGTLWQYWNYKLQYDFTGSGINGLQDAYIDYRGLKPVSIKFGHFKEPFGLQNMTSSKYVAFTERALMSAFSPGRNIGIQLGTHGDNWSLNAGLFGQGRDGAIADDDEGMGVSGRATFSPKFSDNTRLHLGAALSYRNTGSIDSVRFRERPESHVTNRRLVDTGSINANDFTRVGLEAALISGPFSLESEYNYVDLNRANTALADLDFSGYYVQGSWFITGESIPYNAKKGTFGKPRVKGIVGKGGIGAWQLAMRFSSLDLNNADINGGEEQNFSLGLNWYTTPNIRLSANYVNVLDVNGGSSAGDEPDAFQLRAQVEF
jgi:phosphate-selective porin OprO and OprP